MAASGALALGVIAAAIGMLSWLVGRRRLLRIAAICGAVGAFAGSVAGGIAGVIASPTCAMIFGW